MAYPITKFWFYPLCRTLLGRIKGMENIPNNAAFIVISNHEKPALDSALLLYPILRKLNKKMHFIAKTGWWFLGDTICRQWAGCIPLLNPKQAYKEAKELVKSGEIVGFFPESDIKRTHNHKTGAVRLAIETNIPILPMAVKSSKIPLNSGLNIGKPIYLKNDKNAKSQIKELMEYVYKLRNDLG